MEWYTAHWFIQLCVSVDGLTHWSLTGSTMTDEDTFMGFSDGLSQSGTLVLHWNHSFYPKCKVSIQYLFFPSGVSRGGDDSLWSFDVHPAGRCGVCLACGQMAVPAEERSGRLLLHAGTTFSTGFTSVHLLKLRHCKAVVLFQDTCVALQALSEYAILSYVGGVNLTISLASTNLDFQETLELNRDNKKLLQRAKVHTSGQTMSNKNT